MDNLSKYDSHLFFRKLVPDNGIFDSAESFISFYKPIIDNETQYKIYFIDSPCFVASLFDRLSESFAKYECKVNLQLFKK